ncbi:MAG: TonB-dependent vitamin B12 receptor BtuB [Bdellovibrio sp.]
MVTLTALFFSHALAQESITVTAERFARAKTQSTGSVLSFDEDDIRRSGATSLSDILKNESGISTVNNGSFGKSGSLFIRGTDSRHTLILIDDIAINDPTSIAGEPRFEYISLSDVERIEVLKGSQSALYGQQAIGGVIKVTTKKSGERKSNLKVGIGSYDQRMVAGDTKVKRGNLDFFFSGDHQEARGLSATASKQTIQEKDSYSLLRFKARVGIETLHNGRFTFSTQQIKASSDYDNAPSDDANYSHYDQSQFGLQHIIDFQTMSWKNSFQTTKVNRDTTGNYHYEADQRKLETEIFSNNFGLGVSYQKDKAIAFDSVLVGNKILENKSAFARSSIELMKLTLDGAIRYEDIAQYDGELTYRIGANLQTTNFLNFKSSYSTGIKSPSLYQLYGQYGNINLLPEKSRSFDAGFDLHLKNHQFEATFFKIDYEEYINFGTSRYENTSGAEIRGVEISNSSRFEIMDIKASYTRLETRDHTNNLQLKRRPKHAAKISNSYYFFDHFEFGHIFSYLGRRDDVGGVNPSYVLVALNSIYHFNQETSLSLQLDNILDHDYEEVRGYQTAGRSFKLDLRMIW